MRIVFISHWSGNGGAEKALLDIMCLIRECGHEPICIVPKLGGLVEKLRKNNIVYYRIHYTWWTGRHIPWYVRVVRTLLQPIKALVLAYRLNKLSPDIIYTNTSTIVVGAMAARILDIPHIWHVHEHTDIYGFQFDLGKKFSTGVIRRLSNCVIAVSNSVAEDYGLSNSDKLSILYQSIGDLKFQYGLRQQQNRDFFSIAIVGHLDYNKGQEDAINALKFLNDRRIRLFIIGGGEEGCREHLESLVQNIGIQDQVVFAGPLDNPFDLMSKMQCILVCSREAFGRVTAEAMLLGVPVIGSNTGATPELITHGESGLLYEHGNVSDLVKQIRCLMNNKNLVESIRKNGRSKIESMCHRDHYRNNLMACLDNTVASF